jgi:hypothetical protein
MDYQPLRSNNWKLPEPEPEPEEEQESPAAVAVDLVYNMYQEERGKTIALKLSLRLPQKA